MLHALVPRRLALKLRVAKQTRRLLRCLAQRLEAARLVLGEVILRDGELAVRVCAGFLGRGVHAAQVLCEQVFSVEFVVVEHVVVVGVCSREAEIAAPEAEFDVLSADVAFPLVFGGEGRVAAVAGEDTGEAALAVVSFEGLFCGGR
jgi:hypothetical protein